jgi:hypothetical protein
MSDHIHENVAGETWQSLLEHGKADHMPLQAYEVAEFRGPSVNYLEVIIVAVMLVVAIVATIIKFAVQ